MNPQLELCAGRKSFARFPGKAFGAAVRRKARRIVIDPPFCSWHTTTGSAQRAARQGFPEVLRVGVTLDAAEFAMLSLVKEVSEGWWCFGCACFHISSDNIDLIDLSVSFFYVVLRRACSPPNGRQRLCGSRSVLDASQLDPSANNAQSSSSASESRWRLPSSCQSCSRS